MLALMRAGQCVEDIPDPDDLVEVVFSRIEGQIVRRRVAQLPSRERHVLVWRYGLGGPPAPTHEIASRLGVGARTVSALHSRALNRLRESYAVSPSGPRPRV